MRFPKLSVRLAQIAEYGLSSTFVKGDRLTDGNEVVGYLFGDNPELMVLR